MQRLMFAMLLLTVCPAVRVAHAQPAESDITGRATWKMLKITDQDSKLIRLRKELANARLEQYRLVEAMWRNGLRAADAVFAVQREFIDARLEVASSVQERLELLKSLVAAARGAEQAVTAMHEAGQAHPTDVLAARAARIEAEIRLAEEEETQTP